MLSIQQIQLIIVLLSHLWCLDYRQGQLAFGGARIPYYGDINRPWQSFPSVYIYLFSIQFTIFSIKLFSMLHFIKMKDLQEVPIPTSEANCTKQPRMSLGRVCKHLLHHDMSGQCVSHVLYRNHPKLGKHAKTILEWRCQDAVLPTFRTGACFSK